MADSTAETEVLASTAQQLRERKSFSFRVLRND